MMAYDKYKHAEMNGILQNDIDDLQHQWNIDNPMKSYQTLDQPDIPTEQLKNWQHRSDKKRMGMNQCTPSRRTNTVKIYYNWQQAFKDLRDYIIHNTPHSSLLMVRGYSENSNGRGKIIKLVNDMCKRSFLLDIDIPELPLVDDFKFTNGMYIMCYIGSYPS